GRPAVEVERIGAAERLHGERDLDHGDLRVRLLDRRDEVDVLRVEADGRPREAAPLLVAGVDARRDLPAPEEARARSDREVDALLQGERDARAQGEAGASAGDERGPGERPERRARDTERVPGALEREGDAVAGHAPLGLGREDEVAPLVVEALGPARHEAE